MAQTKIAKYDVIKLLRQEPTGEVYLAEDRAEGRQLVVHLITSGGAAVDQARRVAALTHASVGWAGVGLHGDTPYLATEYFDAPTLDDWLHQDPSFGERVRMVAALADALCYVQEQSAVHGALEPSVIRVLGDGDLRLVDFAVGATRPPQSPASVASRAPEVLQGEPYTRQSETHAAAVLFYQILAGLNPFTRPNAAASREAVLNEHPAAIADVRREVPRDLSDAIMACLEKDPEWRPKDLSYVLEVARQASAQTKPSGKPAARKAAPAPLPAPPQPGSLPSFGARPKASAPGGGRGLMIGVAAVVLVGAAVGIWLWLGSRPAPPQSAQGPAPTQPAATAKPVELAPPETTPPATAPARGEDKARGREPEVAQPTPPPVTAPPTTQAAAPTPPPATPPPATPPPATPPPTTVPAQPAVTAPTPAPVLERASLTTVVPPSIRRAARTLVDVRGTGIRRDHRVILLRGKEVAAGISVAAQKLDNPTLLKVMLLVDGAAEPGSYTIALVDPQGEVTNALRLELSK
jgi:hypothetical protein